MTDTQNARRRWSTAWFALGLLVVSAACVAIAPALMPDTYSIMEHSISESAAQGIEGAWLTRLGFLCLGFAVLLLASVAGDRWGAWGRGVHRVYGVSMMAVAAFSHAPWEDVPFDEFEDLLHSMAAFAVGLAFTVGVVFVAIRRERDAWGLRILDWIAFLAGPILPMLMFGIPTVGGLVQRALFAIGYVWYGTESVGLIRSVRPGSPKAAPVQP